MVNENTNETHEESSNDFEKVIQGLPINVMLCEPDTMNIVYVRCHLCQ